MSIIRSIGSLFLQQGQGDLCSAVAARARSSSACTVAAFRTIVLHMVSLTLAAPSKSSRSNSKTAIYRKCGRRVAVAKNQFPAIRFLQRRAAHLSNRSTLLASAGDLGGTQLLPGRGQSADIGSRLEIIPHRGIIRQNHDCRVPHLTGCSGPL